MLFTKHITVPADTSKDDPHVESIPIANGVLTWVSVLFPNGCVGMVYAAVYFHEHRIAPSIENMAMIGNGIPIEWSEYYEIYQPPYELKIKAWSPSTDYDHTITIRAAILPRKAIVALAVTDAFSKLSQLLEPEQAPVLGLPFYEVEEPISID